MIAAIARQANARTAEVAAWTLDRHWPQSRLRQAWVVARYGALAAADSGPAAAGPLEPEQYVRLRRAVARWERNSEARPDGWPAGGLAALLQIGTLAAVAEIPDPPRLLAYAIGRLDQLSKRLRAHNTASSARRLDGAAARARRRRQPTAAPRLQFRASWPAWILLPGHSEPAFDDSGRLQLDERQSDSRNRDTRRRTAGDPRPSPAWPRIAIAPKDGAHERAHRPRPGEPRSRSVSRPGRADGASRAARAALKPHPQLTAP
ncbi:MAG: hypothetical protein ACLP50_06180 [Solirubrobacteraceae bacterium]